MREHLPGTRSLLVLPLSWWDALLGAAVVLAKYARGAGVRQWASPVCPARQRRREDWLHRVDQLNTYRTMANEGSDFRDEDEQRREGQTHNRGRQDLKVKKIRDSR